MKMTVRRMRGPRAWSGLPVFGSKEARVTLAPRPKGSLSWFLIDEQDITAITPENVFCEGQTLCVDRRGQKVAQVIEHLLPLKAAGFFGLSIYTDGSLPYTGSMEPIFKDLMENSLGFEENVPMATVSNHCIWEYPNKRGGETAYTEITPRSDGKLRLKVRINYPGLGDLERDYEFPDEALLAQIAGVRAQGWPRYRYWISRFGRAANLWNHHDHVEWPQHLSESEALSRFANHRCLDLLGALGLLMNGQWLSADVVSVCSGHEADLGVVREASKHLIKW